MPVPAEPQSPSRRALLIWAVSATVLAIALFNTTLILFVKLRDAKARAAATSAFQAQKRIARGAGGVSSAFGQLQDSDVVGRYHLFQEGTNVGIITLLSNHSIINKDGTTFPQYHWEIQPNGLMTRWQRGRIFFDEMVKAGVYVMRSKDGSEYRRIEKLEE
jgi:hypothetical protein